MIRQPTIRALDKQTERPLPAAPFKMTTPGIPAQVRVNSHSRASPPLSSSKSARAFPVPTKTVLQSRPIDAVRSPVLPREDRSIPQREDRMEQMQRHLAKLERGFEDASRQLLQQSESHARDLARATRLEAECARLEQMVQRIDQARIGMKDAATQTLVAPAPIAAIARRPLPPQPMLQSTRMTPLLVVHDEQPSIVTPVETPEMHDVIVAGNENVDPNIRRVSTIASKFGSVTRPRSAGSVGRKSAVELSATAVSAKRILDEIDKEDAATTQSVLEQFDKLDGGKSGVLSRDLCLVMTSLLLEERGIRHCNIPKVICSRVC